MIFVTHDIDEAIYLSNRIVIMSAKPGKIHKVIENNLPYPRSKTSGVIPRNSKESITAV